MEMLLVPRANVLYTHHLDYYPALDDIMSFTSTSTFLVQTSSTRHTRHRHDRVKNSNGSECKFVGSFSMLDRRMIDSTVGNFTVGALQTRKMILVVSVDDEARTVYKGELIFAHGQ